MVSIDNLFLTVINYVVFLLEQAFLASFARVRQSLSENKRYQIFKGKACVNFISAVSVKLKLAL